MKIPKIISKNNHEYIFVKEYPNFVLYEDMITHAKECFTWHELGHRTKQIRIRKVNISNHL
jgi:hypothetical protein